MQENKRSKRRVVRHERDSDNEENDRKKQRLMNEEADLPLDQELFDDLETVKQQAKQVAELIRQKKYTVAYTGAGISTAASIPDYRGPNGVWTMKNAGRETRKSNYENTKPTYAHYALKLLMDKGLLKYVITTNVDGLHWRSGIPVECLNELHGCVFAEFCSNCRVEYRGPYDVTADERTTRQKKMHFTGNKCPQCKKALKDTIVEFDDPLDINASNLAVYHSKRADLSLVLGSSLVVRPSCHFPTLNHPSKKGPNAIGQLVIVNLMKTEFDNAAAVVSHSRTDEFMQLVMQELKLHDEVDQTFDTLKDLLESS